MVSRRKKKHARGDTSYQDGWVDLHAVTEPPSYQAVVDWMAELPDSRSAAFDCWARGNFTRRLLYNRNHGIQPIFVEASHPDEMMWIYRRLALVGVPLDIIYTGPLSKPRWTKVLQPLDIMIDRNRSDPPAHAWQNRVLRDTPESVWQDRLQRDASIETLAGQGRTAKCNFPDTTFSSSTKPPSGD